LEMTTDCPGSGVLILVTRTLTPSVLTDLRPLMSGVHTRLLYEGSLNGSTSRFGVGFCTDFCKESTRRGGTGRKSCAVEERAVEVGGLLGVTAADGFGDFGT